MCGVYVLSHALKRQRAFGKRAAKRETKRESERERSQAWLAATSSNKFLRLHKVAFRCQQTCSRFELRVSTFRCCSIGFIVFLLVIASVKLAADCAAGVEAETPTRLRT